MADWRGEVLTPVSGRAPARDPMSAYLSSLLPTTQRSQSQALELIASVLSEGTCSAQSLPWEQLSPRHTKRIRAWLADKYSPGTVNRHLSALRGVLREAWCLRLMSAERYYRAAMLISPGPGRPRERALRQGELRALLSVCGTDQTAAGPRDAAMVLLLFRTGIRPRELVHFDLGDYHPQSGLLRLGVRHPNLPERVAIATPATRRALAEWQPHRRPDRPPLLQRVTPEGEVNGERLQVLELGRMLRDRAEEATLTRQLGL